MADVEVEDDLRKAIEKGQVKVLYQPIVYLPTKELAGFEALVRWEHPQHGLLIPLSLVTVVEQSDADHKARVLRHGSCGEGCGALADRVAASRSGRSSSASIFRAGSFSGLRPFRKSGMSWAATSCRPARCDSKSPKAWSWKIRSRPRKS